MDGRIVRRAPIIDSLMMPIREESFRYVDTIRLLTDESLTLRLNCVQLSKASSLYKALRTTNRQYLEARHPCHACTRAGIYVT